MLCLEGLEKSRTVADFQGLLSTAGHHGGNHDPPHFVIFMFSTACCYLDFRLPRHLQKSVQMF